MIRYNKENFMKNFTVLSLIIVLSFSFATCIKNGSTNSFSPVNASNSISTSYNGTETLNRENSNANQLSLETKTPEYEIIPSQIGGSNSTGQGIKITIINVNTYTQMSIELHTNRYFQDCIAIAGAGISNGSGDFFLISTQDGKPFLTPGEYAIQLKSSNSYNYDSVIPSYSLKLEGNIIDYTQVTKLSEHNAHGL